MLSDKTLRLVPDPRRCTAKFLHHVLCSGQVRDQVDSLLSGSTGQANVSQKNIAELRVPEVGLRAQHRIVEVLDSAQGRIDAEEAALLKHDSLWEGVLDAELERHHLNHGSSRLIDVCLAGGQYGSNSPASPHRLGLPRYIRITDIDEKGFLSPGGSEAASISLGAADRYILAEGDLLIARTGYTTGKSYLYAPSDGLCAFAGYLVRFRIDPSKMLPEYAFLWTHGKAFRGWVSRNIHEVGQRNISAREYNEHEIAHPPLEEQRKLVDAVRAARAARKLRTTEVDRLRTLRSALADDLFGGRVPLQEIS
ncbi:hypothetical protein ACFXPY_29805 [Streptomyces sp. NPDC059153]|uniref:restriction endonuclease subunit S n=1 Tax=Streptomyces sp. NPDC059153 TaxID=3346743 RepID=UPI00368A7CF2